MALTRRRARRYTENGGGIADSPLHRAVKTLASKLCIRPELKGF